MKITWHGHSCIQIDGTKTILFDPFITGNPVAKISADDFSKIDFIVVTHDHMDHYGDTEKLAAACGSTVISIHEIAEKCSRLGIRSEGMNIGGTVESSGVSFHMVNAVHSGDTCGMIVMMDGKTFYHAGDTALFSDMSIYGELFRIDVAFLPIGDRYTMGPVSAAKAVSLLKTLRVIPIHYGTFPQLTGSCEEFRKLVRSAEVTVLSPGEHTEI